ncbi:MAG TPA: aldo/keto reductase [Gammaproteobacteria bacterium]|nr:aldo/keto reductase [Gammaproteobacteria bacterium]
MADGNAAHAGEFRLGGKLPVHRLGFGAMRITGSDVWGAPRDRAEALRTLRLVPELGVNFIDTADAYGPDVSEPLIREALHPYPQGLVIATKGGQVRPGPNLWVPLGRPEYLTQQVKLSLRRLGVEQIALWQLHRIDPKVPRAEQFGTIREFLDQGLIRYAGLSEVNVEEIEAAQKIFPVAAVQNRYHAHSRRYEPVLEYCAAHHIGFIPWAPLAAGRLANPGSPFEQVARRHGATPGQVAIAWLLKRSPVMLPIPGTSRVAHLEENVAAADLVLTDEEFVALAHSAPHGGQPPPT